MKTKPLFIACILSILLGGFASISHAQLFGGDDSKHEQIQNEVKKMNTRLMSQLFPRLEKMEKNQTQLFQTLETLNKNFMKRQGEMNQQVRLLSQSLASLQGSFEQGQGRIEKANSSLKQNMQSVTAQIGDLGLQLKKDMEGQGKAQLEILNHQAANQKLEQEALKKAVTQNLGDLKVSLAKDMEKMASSNQQTVNALNETNTKNMQAIKAGFQNQDQRLGQAISALGDIAKLEAQNAKLILDSVQKGHQAITAGLTPIQAGTQAIQEKNAKLIEILSQNLKHQQDTLTRLDTLVGHQENTKKNVDLTRETILKLKEILDKRMADNLQVQTGMRTQNDQVLKQVDVIQKNLLITDKKMVILAEGFKTLDQNNATSLKQIEGMQKKLTAMQSVDAQTHEKFAKLVDATQVMLANASETNKKVDQALEKLDAGRTESTLNSQKISQLIDILKNIAKEQGKFTQVLDNQNKINTNVVSAAETVNKNLGTVQSHMTTTLDDVQKRLEDLRRKANVTIARNDDILKLVKK